jgi:hypothetical protein
VATSEDDAESVALADDDAAETVRSDRNAEKVAIRREDPPAEEAPQEEMPPMTPVPVPHSWLDVEDDPPPDTERAPGT